MSLQPKIYPSNEWVKVVFTFAETRRVWTETHYYNGIGPGALPAAMSAAGRLAQQRITFLATNCYLTNIVCSVSLLDRNTLSSTFLAATPGQGGDEDNTPNDCYRLLVRGGNNYRTELYLGGIPDLCLVNDAIVLNGTGQFYPGFTGYLNLLANGYWGWLPVRQNTSGSLRSKILSIAQTNIVGPVITVATATNHGITGTKTMCRIGRVPNTTADAPWNQLWYVSYASNTTVTLNNPPLPLPAGYVNYGGGFITPQVRVFQAYTQLGFQTAGKRNRGVKTNAPRARNKLNRTLGY